MKKLPIQWKRSTESPQILRETVYNRCPKCEGHGVIYEEGGKAVEYCDCAKGEEILQEARRLSAHTD